jgi:hypothetical protein
VSCACDLLQLQERQSSASPSSRLTRNFLPALGTSSRRERIVGVASALRSPR